MLAAPLRQRILEALAEPGVGLHDGPRPGARAARRSPTTCANSRSMASSSWCARRSAAAARSRVVAFDGPVPSVASRRCWRRAWTRGTQGQALPAAALIALASPPGEEVGEAQAIAEKAGKRLPTLSSDVEIRLRSPREREAFAEELLGGDTRTTRGEVPRRDPPRRPHLPRRRRRPSIRSTKRKP